ncbi:MAG: CoA-acylating methylmalonate-semialdehyde dehydrogenase [Candidatus Glassbacteria bacterium]|nr:CoA-acylating methylmalonate-semialdehyde dehydrogenase [Candidatus Glassbacteria bacterium]
MTTHISEQAQSTRHEVFNPASGEVVGHVDWSTPEQVNAAVEAAAGAYPDWSGRPVKERAQVMFRLKQVIESSLDELSELCSAENGKTVAESKAGILKGVEVVEYAASLPQLIAGQYLEVSRGVSCRTVRDPLGVAASITPFNFPVMVPLWMIPLALGCGNTLVHKPSEHVPLSAVRLREYLLEAGLPGDACRVVHGGRQAVETLVENPAVRAIGFVGSSRVAEIVYRRATSLNKRVLALGGAKNHLVLLPDADPEASARNIVDSFTGCCGQRCMAASVLLAVGGAQEMISAVAEKARRILPGRDMGPVISAEALKKITAYIDQAQADGAEVLVDGREAGPPAGGEKGFWIGPTVLDRVTPEMSVAREEIFGPVLSVIRVSTVEEALAVERASEYGNAAAVYTQNGFLARRCIDSFNSSMIGVNIGVPVPREPFSFGGRNRSRFGYGDITGAGAIEFWTQTRKITERWSPRKDADWMS